MLEAVAEMIRSFVVGVYEICCWALGFVGARVRWEDVRLVVTSFIACWGARCCLQAHIRYRVKFVARVLVCLLFASSCQLCCQVCSSFGPPATPRGKVVGTILRQRSCCGSLKMPFWLKPLAQALAQDLGNLQGQAVLGVGVSLVSNCLTKDRPSDNQRVDSL